jgi:hypothetical protein
MGSWFPSDITNINRIGIPDRGCRCSIDGLGVPISCTKYPRHTVSITRLLPGLDMGLDSLE